jgi:Holliday junction resolvasome RuvABC endonuclease subunit
MARIRIEDIRAELEHDGWKVISNEYVNLDTEMIFECDEGHKVYAPWKKIRQKRECTLCKQNIYKNQDHKVIPKKKGTFRVLALDQATKITGYSIYDNKQLIYYGIFEADENEKEIVRDIQAKHWLVSIIENWKPDMVGLEGIQYEEKFGVTTFETLARLQGILMGTLCELDIPYKVCPTPTWRAHCGVKGQSRIEKKRSMKGLIKKWFDVQISDDEADAIGIGKYLSDTATPVVKITNWE